MLVYNQFNITYSFEIVFFKGSPSLGSPFGQSMDWDQYFCPPPLESTDKATHNEMMRKILCKEPNLDKSCQHLDKTDLYLFAIGICNILGGSQAPQSQCEGKPTKGFIWESRQKT